MTTFIRVRSAEGPTDEYLVSDAQLAAAPDDYVVIDTVETAAPTKAPDAKADPEPSVGETNEEGV